MAYGLHWEWRGFGPLDAPTRERIAALVPLTDTQQLTDHYLWTPGCIVNVKLRPFGAGRLKFKRLVRRDPIRRLELWLESPEEDYDFPVPPIAISRLSEALGIDLPAAITPVARPMLVDWLSRSGKVHFIEVPKRRTAYRWARGDQVVRVELADIAAPTPITSVAIENDEGIGLLPAGPSVAQAAASVVSARDALGLNGPLETLNYLEMLARWQAADD